jgi:16S rRNA (guanine1207-N2)-methyltransferase
MSHYFKDDQNLNHDIRKKTIFINDIKLDFYTDRGVFSKEKLDFGTKVLLKHVTVEPTVKTIVDMGCGYGPIGIYLAKTNQDKQIFMYDVNPRAIDLTTMNLKLNDVSNANVELSHLFERFNQKADLIITNPPIRAGKQIIFNLYDQAYDLLNQGGSFYCVIQKKQGAPSTYNKLVSLFDNCEIVAKEKGYWILLSRK